PDPDSVGGERLERPPRQISRAGPVGGEIAQAMKAVDPTPPPRGEESVAVPVQVRPLGRRGGIAGVDKYRRSDGQAEPGAELRRLSGGPVTGDAGAPRARASRPVAPDR